MVCRLAHLKEVQRRLEQITRKHEMQITEHLTIYRVTWRKSVLYVIARHTKHSLGDKPNLCPDVRVEVLKQFRLEPLPNAASRRRKGKKAEIR